MENYLASVEFYILALIFLIKGSYGQVLIGPIPTNQAVLFGTNHTLTCQRGPEGAAGDILWQKDTDPIETLFYKQDRQLINAKYANFNLDPDNLYDLVITSIAIEDEGTYTCRNTRYPTSVQFVTITVEVNSNSTFMAQNGAEVITVTVITGEPSDIVCSAIGARPAVTIDWYHQLPGGYESLIAEGVSQVNYTNSVDSYTFDTVSTLQYNANKDYNGGTLRCVTRGQVVAENRESITLLNVQYVPIVEVLFADGKVTCISDANPETTTYVIAVNNTDEYILRRSGGICTLSLNVEFDTEIRCNTSNDLGTGTAATVAILTVPDRPAFTSSLTTSIHPTSPAGSTDFNIDGTTNVYFGAVLGGVFGALLAICIVIIVIFVSLFVIRNNKNTNKTASPKHVTPIEYSSPSLPQTYLELDPQTCEYESPYQQPLPQTPNLPFDIIATETTPLEDMSTYEELDTNISQGHGTPTLPLAYMALDSLTRENTSAYQELETQQGHDTSNSPQAYMALNSSSRVETSAYYELDTNNKSQGHETSDMPQAYMALDSSSRVETTEYHELDTNTAAIKQQGNQHEAYEEIIGTELKDQIYNEIGEDSYCQKYVNV